MPVATNGALVAPLTTNRALTTVLLLTNGVNKQGMVVNKLGKKPLDIKKAPVFATISDEKLTSFQNEVSKVANSGNEVKNVFPSNPDDLLPEISRNKITKPNGTISQTIYTSDGFRIRAEQHALLPGEVYNPRHHGVHYHLEYKVDLTKSWNNKNNVHKLYPNGSGSGFLPGEAFPN